MNSVGNTITRNSIHDNDREGITLSGGGNIDLRVPFILGVDLQAGSVTGWTHPNAVVELLSGSDAEGAFYEGQIVADSRGFFAFTKDASFTGPRLTANATDPEGNTSEFARSTEGSSRYFGLQEGNSLEMTPLQSKTSSQLVDDVRLGKNYYFGPGDLLGLMDYAHNIFEWGVKRLNINLSEVETPVDWSFSETEIPVDFDRFIDLMNENGDVSDPDEEWRLR